MESMNSTERLRDLIGAVDAISILNPVYLSGLSAFWVYLTLLEGGLDYSSIGGLSLIGAGVAILLTYAMFFVRYFLTATDRKMKDRLYSLLVVKLNFASSALLINTAKVSASIEQLYSVGLAFVPGLLWYSWWRTTRQEDNGIKTRSETVVEAVLIGALTLWTYNLVLLSATTGEYWHFVPNVIILISPFFVSQVKHHYLMAVKKRVSEEVYIDPLTKANNRKCFYDVYDEHRQLYKAKELTSGRLVFVFIDVDMFKKYNDRYGHEAGDDCLVEVARFIEEKAEILGLKAYRYGGEEFLMYGVTEDESAIASSDFVQSWLAGSVYLDREHEDMDGGKVTLSGGAKSFPIADIYENNAKGFLNIVDQLLYKAKESRKILVSELVDKTIKEV